MKTASTAQVIVDSATNITTTNSGPPSAPDHGQDVDVTGYHYLTLELEQAGTSGTAQVFIQGKTIDGTYGQMGGGNNQPGVTFGPTLSPVFPTTVRVAWFLSSGTSATFSYALLAQSLS